MSLFRVSVLKAFVVIMSLSIKRLLFFFFFSLCTQRVASFTSSRTSSRKWRDGVVQTLNRRNDTAEITVSSHSKCITSCSPFMDRWMRKKLYSFAIGRIETSTIDRSKHLYSFLIVLWEIRYPRSTWSHLNVNWKRSSNSSVDNGFGDGFGRKTKTLRFSNQCWKGHKNLRSP